MAATTALEARPATTEDELSDEQIEQLLAKAAARLQSKALAQASKDESKHGFNFPRLDAGELEKPYMTTKGDVTTVDATKMLEDKQRKHADGIRKVEDPVAAKNAAAEVSHTPAIYVSSDMRKTIPISS